MRARKSGSNRVHVHRWLALALLVNLVVGGANLTYGQDEDGVGALNRMGRRFARIAERAYPGVAVIRVQKPALLKSQDRMGRRGRVLLEDVWMVGPGEPTQLDRFGPSAGDALDLFFQAGPGRQRSQGLGVVVSADGYIITNHHVVDDARKIEVELADGRSFAGKVVGEDAETDLAVVKIDAENLKVLELADSDEVKLGDWTIAIGNPMGIGRTFDVGLITGMHRSGLGMAPFEDFILTGAVPGLGSGGGPLLDLRGRVVGINTAAVGGDYGGGVGLAIPANLVRQVYQQLIETGSVSRGFLGVFPQDIDGEMAKALGVEAGAGAVIAHLNEDSPAGKAGLKRQDIIVEFNGQKISSSNQLRDYVARVKPNTKAEVVILRDGKRKRVEVTLGERPSAK